MNKIVILALLGLLTVSGQQIIDTAEDQESRRLLQERGGSRGRDEERSSSGSNRRSERKERGMRKRKSSFKFEQRKVWRFFDVERSSKENPEYRYLFGDGNEATYEDWLDFDDFNRYLNRGGMIEWGKKDVRYNDRDTNDDEIGLAEDNICAERCMNANCSEYRGNYSTTRKGHTCQKWSEQSPNTHQVRPDRYPGKGLGEHNFCRNPDGDSTAWCVINETGTGYNWDYCDINEQPNVCGEDGKPQQRDATADATMQQSCDPWYQLNPENQCEPIPNYCMDTQVQDDQGNCTDYVANSWDQLMDAGWQANGVIQRIRDLRDQMEGMKREGGEVMLMDQDNFRVNDCSITERDRGECEKCEDRHFQSDRGDDCVRVGAQKGDAKGEIFMGTSRNGVREGKGEYRWPDGKRFVGHFENNNMVHGEYIMPDGTRQPM